MSRFYQSNKIIMKLKVCGMKYGENIKQIANLQPDYMGFIFYERSKRNFEGILPEIPKSIKKTGVFVNEYVEIVISLVEEYNLEAIQLHGDESEEYIINLKAQLDLRKALFIEENKLQKKKINKHIISNVKVEIIKVFAINNEFDFQLLHPYLNYVDYFLFDAKGKERGGNGTKFDWSILHKYNFDKPFFLSGGIGLEDSNEIVKIIDSNLPIHALDINSKFEIEPGLKNINQVKIFKKTL